jgi:uncharacterized CHY-type Zn-finger protein
MVTDTGTSDCQGCDKCKTTYSGHPDHHKELQPHKWKKMYHQNTGKPFKICKVCGEMDQESYIKAMVPDKQEETQ